MNAVAPILLTEPQAAAMLSLSARTLRKARTNGDLTYVLYGAAVRYTMADLEQFAARFHQQDQAPCRPTATKPKSRAVQPGERVIVPFTARGNR